MRPLFDLAGMRADGFAFGPVGGQAADGIVRVDDAGLIFRGDYVRDGADLVITGEGQRLVVPDYFSAPHRPKLVAPNGASLPDDVIEALARPAHGVQVAQAGPAPATDASGAIGRVQTLSGGAAVVRNGVTVTLHAGDLVYKGDVVQTDRGAALAVAFLDGSLFSLAGNARMVLNELVYQPGGADNRSLINLVQGSLSFVAGQVAKTGDMKVGTPVATMGIRGTAVRASVIAEDGTTSYAVITEPATGDNPQEHTGRFDIYDRDDPTRLLATVSDPKTAVVVRPTGTAEARVEQVPKTAEEMAHERTLVQSMQATQAEAPRLPVYTGPSTGGGTSSGTAPSLVLPPPGQMQPPAPGLPAGPEAGPTAPGAPPGPGPVQSPPSEPGSEPPRTELPGAITTASAAAPLPATAAAPPVVPAPAVAPVIAVAPAAAFVQAPAAAAPAAVQVVAEPAPTQTAATPQPAVPAPGPLPAPGPSPEPAPQQPAAPPPAPFALQPQSGSVTQGQVLAADGSGQGVLGQGGLGTGGPGTGGSSAQVVSARPASGPDTGVAGSGATLPGQYGTLTLHPDGTYVYRADHAAVLAQGQQATDVFSITAQAADGTRSTAPLAILVTGINDAPSITSGGGTATVLTPTSGAAPQPLSAGQSALAAAGAGSGGTAGGAGSGGSGTAGSLVNGLGGTGGFGETVLDIGDDNSSGAIDIRAVFGTNGLNFFGTYYTSLYVNNNGNITFGAASSSYRPSPITAASPAIIAPFFADVDTRGGATAATPGGTSTGSDRVYLDLDADRHTLTVTWDDVGYYAQHTDRANAFQVQLVGRGDGDFDIVYRYEAVNWTTGDASGAVVARAGYAAGNGVNFYELPQSGNAAQLQALPTAPGNTGSPGVYVFQAYNGAVTPVTALQATGAVGFTDADAGDHHTATAHLDHVTVSASGSGASAEAVTALQTALGTALTAAVTGESSAGSAGTVTWSFALPSSAAAFLRQGESVTATYAVGVGDGLASAATTVRVTINGIDDAPTAGGTHAIRAAVGGTVTLSAAAFGATDPDTAAADLRYAMSGTGSGSLGYFTRSDGTGTAEVTTFTQREIDAGQIAYHAQAAGSASLSFTLTDGTSTVSGNYTIGPPPSQSAGPGGVQGSPATPGVTALTQRQLDGVVAAAIADWRAAGASAAQIALLTAASFAVADLSGTALGQEAAGRVTIDADAAGAGWYVDPTPLDDAEFPHAANAAGTARLTDPSQAAAGHYDLLTVVMHEMGHVLGLPVSGTAGAAGTLMDGTLALGERRLPSAADAATARAAPAAPAASGPLSLHGTADTGHAGAHEPADRAAEPAAQSEPEPAGEPGPTRERVAPDPIAAPGGSPARAESADHAAAGQTASAATPAPGAHHPAAPAGPGPAPAGTIETGHAAPAGHAASGAAGSGVAGSGAALAAGTTQAAPAGPAHATTTGQAAPSGETAAGSGHGSTAQTAQAHAPQPATHHAAESETATPSPAESAAHGQPAAATQAPVGSIAAAAGQGTGQGAQSGTQSAAQSGSQSGAAHAPVQEAGHAAAPSGTGTSAGAAQASGGSASAPASPSATTQSTGQGPSQGSNQGSSTGIAPAAAQETGHAAAGPSSAAPAPASSGAHTETSATPASSPVTSQGSSQGSSQGTPSGATHAPAQETGHAAAPVGTGATAAAPPSSGSGSAHASPTATTQSTNQGSSSGIAPAAAQETVHAAAPAGTSPVSTAQASSGSGGTHADVPAPAAQGSVQGTAPQAATQTVEHGSEHAAAPSGPHDGQPADAHAATGRAPSPGEAHHAAASPEPASHASEAAAGGSSGAPVAGIAAAGGPGADHGDRPDHSDRPAHADRAAPHGPPDDGGRGPGTAGEANAAGSGGPTAHAAGPGAAAQQATPAPSRPAESGQPGGTHAADAQHDRTGADAHDAFDFPQLTVPQVPAPAPAHALLDAQHDQFGFLQIPALDPGDATGDAWSSWLDTVDPHLRFHAAPTAADHPAAPPFAAAPAAGLPAQAAAGPDGADGFDGGHPVAHAAWHDTIPHTLFTALHGL